MLAIFMLVVYIFRSALGVCFTYALPRGKWWWLLTGLARHGRLAALPLRLCRKAVMVLLGTWKGRVTRPRLIGLLSKGFVPEAERNLAICLKTTTVGQES